jgi:hypothetical protein
VLGAVGRHDPHFCCKGNEPGVQEASRWFDASQPRVVKLRSFAGFGTQRITLDWMVNCAIVANYQLACHIFNSRHVLAKLRIGDKNLHTRERDTR